MKPLSVIYYCLENKKKLFSMMISIGFSVALIYSLQFLVDVIKHSSYYTGLNALESYSEVKRKTNQPITDEIIQSILEDENTEKVIPRVAERTFYYPIAGRYSISLFSLSREDMIYFINRLDLELIEGRLPAEGTNEIVMDYRVAKNKKIKLGEKIGYAVDEKELYITGEHEVVGFLDGDSMIMFMPRQDEIEEANLFHEGIIVFHKQGKLQQSNQFLEGLPQKIVEVSTHKIEYEAQEKDTKDIKKYMGILVIMLIMVLSISTGNASYINTYQRRFEFGLLNSVGYSSTDILKKATIEIFFINAMGFIAGFILAMIIAGIEYIFLFEPKGLVLRLFLPDAILQTLAIPIFTSLFSVIPVSRMLKKIDPISIIEGVE